jgi:deoxyribonuclease V
MRFLFLALYWLLVLPAAATQTDFASHIASLIDPGKLATLGSRGANQRVQKSVYWLAMARQSGQKPGDVLNNAVALVRYRSDAAKLTRDALLRNLDIAEKLGCLNTAGLAEMRRGKAATVMKGPYKGDELSVDHIIPRAIVPELDNVIANLELMPLRLNEKKNSTIGDRQRDMAKKFYHAGLLSREVPGQPGSQRFWKRDEICLAMIACLDVDYREAAAYAAALAFHNWADATPATETVIPVVGVHPYQPGQFFRRELPCLLVVLRELPPVTVVVVDGYVWLDGVSVAGLGAHLYQALVGKIAVIGVAKTRFARAAAAVEVFRGRSTRPLFVTAAGMSAQKAAEHIRSMHGPNRIPTLLKRVDSLCRKAG